MEKNKVKNSIAMTTSFQLYEKRCIVFRISIATILRRALVILFIIYFCFILFYLSSFWQLHLCFPRQTEILLVEKILVIVPKMIKIFSKTDYERPTAGAKRTGANSKLSFLIR